MAHYPYQKHTAEIRKRDGYKCVRCHSKKKLTTHHITPRAQGGSNKPRNLATLCANCHDYVEINEVPWDQVVDFYKSHANRSEKRWYGKSIDGSVFSVPMGDISLFDKMASDPLYL